jgi:lambda repressor-like predicted transcriptional regulator
MSSSERQRLDEERLEEEIEELRSDLGETVEALAHKADVPARVKERGTAVKEDAIERGLALRQQAIERGSELVAQTVRTAQWAREAARQASADRRVKLTGALAAAGAGLLAMTVIVRKVRG